MYESKPDTVYLELFGPLDPDALPTIKIVDSIAGIDGRINAVDEIYAADSIPPSVSIVLVQHAESDSLSGLTAWLVTDEALQSTVLSQGRWTGLSGVNHIMEFPIKLDDRRKSGSAVLDLPAGDIPPEGVDLILQLFAVGLGNDLGTYTQTLRGHQPQR